jgi:hypothetical protein
MCCSPTQVARQRASEPVSLYRTGERTIGIWIIRDIVGENPESSLINIIFQKWNGLEYSPVDWNSSFTWKGNPDDFQSKGGGEVVLKDIGDFDRVVVTVTRDDMPVYDAVFDSGLNLVSNES